MRPLNSPTIRKSDCEDAIWIDTQHLEASVIALYDTKLSSTFFVTFNKRSSYVVETGLVVWVKICMLYRVPWRLYVTWLLWLTDEPSLPIVCIVASCGYSNEIGTQECETFFVYFSSLLNNLQTFGVFFSFFYFARVILVLLCQPYFLKKRYKIPVFSVFQLMSTVISSALFSSVIRKETRQHGMSRTHVTET